MRLTVEGTVETGFEAVREVFISEGQYLGEGGAAFAVVRDGVPIVDLWAGRAGPGPWRSDTRAVLMSATKGIAATAVAILAERHELEVEAPVAHYWPAFAAAGKAEVTVAQLLSHTAGVITIPGYRDFIGAYGEGWERTDEILRRLESAQPEWPPGAANGYHGLTFGWLLGELVRRVSGVSLGTVVYEEIVRPLGLELDLGTPSEIQGKVAPVIVAGPPLASDAERARLGQPESLFSKMILAVDGHCVLDAADRIFGDPARLAIELPGSNATGTARALAGLYGALAAPGRASAALLAPATIERFAAERVRGPSRLTGAEERWGLGFARPTASAAETEWPPRDEAFGHPGLGGQLGFADPVAGVGVGFVRSHLSSFGVGNSLVSALYRCLRGS